MAREKMIPSVLVDDLVVMIEQSDLKFVLANGPMVVTGQSIVGDWMV